MSKQPRQSNFELLRIVAMLLIVTHHYVVNSTVLSCFGGGGADLVNYAFLKLIGAWGKMAINPFVMITGFFMCTSNLTLRRFAKLFIEWYFYSWIIYCAFLLSGLESASPMRLLAMIFKPFKGVDVGFTSSFIWFYLGVPIYNIIIKALDKKGLYILTAALLAMFVIPITFFGNANVFHHVFWYMTLYFVGACIRLYPFAWMTKSRIVFPLLVVSVMVASVGSFAKVLVPCFITKALAVVCRVHESSTLFAFAIGTLLFLTFKNLRIGYHKWINTIASCMFGVLLIHASSDAMRLWLWQHVCRVPEMAHASLWLLATHALGCVVAIMIVCSLIDLARQKWIEKPIFEKFTPD